MKYLKLIRGYIRNFFGFCPQCNSDAPEMYDCNVCGYDTKFPPSKATRKKRMKEFKSYFK